MSHISNISIKHYRGIENLTQDFSSEKFIVLIGRGDSGKSTILSAINSVLCPSWNLSFSDLDFYNQDTTHPIEIELTIKELPNELLKESKFGLYIQNDINDTGNQNELTIIIKLTVDFSLEPHWVVKSRKESDIEDKPISGAERALLAVNFITDYTDNQFAYNRQSPLYALTKATLGEGNTIEQVKSELIRTMAGSVLNDQLKLLDAPLSNLSQTAGLLGLEISELCAQLDIKENPYTGNSISLHDEHLPYRLKGKGSKRLMSIAIQSELTQQGGIILVDELEQGLEPDRITLLVRKLKNIDKGQVFITTHNANVVSESECHNLFIRFKGTNELHNVTQDLYACHRYNPQVFFAKKIIMCEGDTEDGFMRSVDKWLWEKKGISFSSVGVAWANVGGGSNMYDYALRLQRLGYTTCVFADNDKPSEQKAKKNECINSGINLFLCQEGYFIEKQLMLDFTINALTKVIKCDQLGFPKTHVIPTSKFEPIISNNAMTNEYENQIKEKIAVMSNTDKWFKHIQGGEFLGRVFTQDWDQEDNTHMKQTILSLLKWCNIDI